MLTMAALSQASYAQNFGFNQGDIILEGSIGVSSNDNKTTEVKSSSINLNPVIGYFVSDKLAVGVKPGYYQSKNTNYSGSDDTYSKTNSLGADLFGRYYFLEAGARLKVFTELDLGYSSSYTESYNGITKIKSDNTNTFGANAGIGANYFLTDHIAIGYQFSNLIGFNSSKLDNSSAKPTNSAYVNLNNFSNFFNAGQFSLTFQL